MVCPAHDRGHPVATRTSWSAARSGTRLLLAVVGSGYLVRRLPVSLPLPLWQIALGAVSAGVFNQGAALAPEICFLLFLLALLFLDGWRIPTRNKATILVRGGWWGSPWSGPVSWPIG